MYNLIVFVPSTHSQAVRDALARSGAGKEGNYDSCSFSSRGEGRFRPLDGAHPAIGRVGEVCVVEEDRIEAVVHPSRVTQVVEAVRKAHPYEEPAIHLMQVLDYKAFLPPAASSSPSPPSSPPFSVVLEGLDGIGKSTAVEALAARISAVTLRTPPDSMRAFRSYFAGDGVEDTAMRKAYYVVGNFVAGTDMEEAKKAGKNVVIDRYHSSTVSYMLGKSDKPLPEAGDPAYAWPPQLPRPDHMVLLTLPEQARVARRAARAEVEETGEEALLRQRPDIPLRINEAYRRFGCTEVALDPSDGVDAVVDKILAALGRGRDGRLLMGAGVGAGAGAGTGSK
jgi:thymidylate kinase